MDDLISRQAAIDALMPIFGFYREMRQLYKSASLRNRNVFSTARKCMAAIEDLPSAQPEGYVRIPETGIDDLSDGFHTFRQLYYQRMMLFATIVKQNREKAWKSLRHEDGELCFGGGWFIVGIDTPEGSYTYHYEDNYFSLFDCKELERGKHWDGHTEKDVTRLLSLPSSRPERTCVNCGRTVNNGGWYADGRTRCPIEEHYALPKDGYCHLWEKRNVTDDDYPERREE